MKLLDINAYLSYPTNKMITIGDVVGSFIAWPIGDFACQDMLSKLKYKFIFQNKHVQVINGEGIMTRNN